MGGALSIDDCEELGVSNYSSVEALKELSWDNSALSMYQLCDKFVSIFSNH